MLEKLISSLPYYIQKIIFYYIPLDWHIKGETKLIQNIIRVYNVDHDYDLSKRHKKYYIKNILPFDIYVFRTLRDCPFGYDDGPEFGRYYYDNWILGPRISEAESEL